MSVKIRPDFNFILDKHDARVLIIGTDGSGKTVLMHWLAEQYHKRGVPVAYLAPRTVIQAKVTPKWMKLYHWKYPRFERNTVILIDDAQLQIHAREHYKRRNITYDKIFTVARHRHAGILMTTQETFRIDKNLMSRLHFLLIKQPSLFAAQTERPWLRKTLNDVTEEFAKLPSDVDPRQYTYVVSDAYIGMVGPTGLPKYWTTELGDW